MKVLGITGSMAMGKSTVARMAAHARRGAVRIDADKVVHQLLAPGGAAVEEVGEVFPNALRVRPARHIDRQALAAEVFADPAKLARLEAILHRRVRAANLRSIRQARAQRRPLVVLEIPLLFETGAEAICDEVWTVSAPAFLQRQRALRRHGMTEEKLRAALARQWADAKKRHKADRVIPTGLGRGDSRRRVRAALR